MRRVLVISAHPDDAELGCGGTMVAHMAAGDEVTLLVVTNGEVGPGDTAERIQEQERACDVMGVARLIWGNLPDCRVSLHELETVHLIESALGESGADLIYTHSLRDSHQDHRAVAAATTGAARKKSNILAYDAPSSIGFQAGLYVDISDTVDKKIDALMCHRSQVDASEMVDAGRVRNSAGYRGHEARVAFAEAFEVVRYVVTL